jgi:hypothetical protein
MCISLCSIDSREYYNNTFIVGLDQRDHVIVTIHALAVVEHFNTIEAQKGYMFLPLAEPTGPDRGTTGFRSIQFFPYYLQSKYFLALS